MDIRTKNLHILNKTNGKLYNKVTKDYENTADKIEYSMALEPNITNLFLSSLYCDNFYDNKNRPRQSSDGFNKITMYF